MAQAERSFNHLARIQNGRRSTMSTKGLLSIKHELVRKRDFTQVIDGGGGLQKCLYINRPNNICYLQAHSSLSAVLIFIRIMCMMKC